MYFEKQKNGPLHHNESQYFIEDIYQKEVGKTELDWSWFFLRKTAHFFL